MKSDSKNTEKSGRLIALIVISVAVLCWAFIHEINGHLPWRVQSALVTELADSESLTRLTPLLLDVDGMHWIRNTERMVVGNSWRVRWTHLDNPPAGRPVEWSSPPVWWLAGLGSVLGFLGADNGLHAAGLWSGPVLFWLGAVAAFALAIRFFGWASLAGILLLVPFPMVYGDFPFADPDHHGFLDYALLVMLIALAGGITAAQRSENGRGAARFALAGLATAFGFWIAASQMVVLCALAGFGGLLVAALLGVNLSGKAAIGRGFRIWGVVGAACALLFYLIEFFPLPEGRSFFRLEVNHPFWAVALAAGGFVLGDVFEAGGHPGTLVKKGVLFWCSLPWLIAVPVAVVAFGWHTMLDPMMIRFHKLIAEFQPLPSIMGVAGYFGEVGLAPLVAGFVVWRGWLSSGRSETGAGTGTLFCGILALLLHAVAFAQLRWLGLALFATSAAVIASVEMTPRGRWEVRVLLLLVALTVAGPVHRTAGRASLPAAQFALPSALEKLACLEIMDAMASGEGNRPAVMSYPTLVPLSFYGGIPTVISPYWENPEGLHRTVEFYAAHHYDPTFQELREQGISHLLVVGKPASVMEINMLAGRSAELGDVDKSSLIADLSATPSRIPAALEEIPLPGPAGQVFGWKLFRLR